MTLEELKQRPLNKEYMEYLDRRLDEYNIGVYRRRMRDSNRQDYWIKAEIYHMTHDGNDPFSNEEMLDNARCFIEKEVFTDEEWNKYFIPAINEMIDYNNTFERWHPGYLIKDVDGNLSIVKYDYSEAYGGRDFTSLSVCDLDEKGNIISCHSWEEYEDYCLVSKDPEVVNKNLEKIRKYKKERKAPIRMNKKLAKLLGYSDVHTYESALHQIQNIIE